MPKITYIYNKNNPSNITNTSVKRPRHLIESRIFIYNKVLDNPPKFRNSQIDYFYILTYLARTLDIFEANKQQVSGPLRESASIDEPLLKNHLEEQMLSVLFHSLISGEALYYVTHIRLYRRYFDNITNIVVSLQKTMSP